MSRFEEWAKRRLCETDAVVIATTTNVWDIYDIVQPLVGFQQKVMEQRVE